MSRVNIPCVVPELFLSESLVIVGSSASLKGSHMGQKVDSFDDIIRFNRAPTKNYSIDVGERTTLIVTNNHVFNNNDISGEGYTDQPKDFVRNLRNERILYASSDYGPLHNRVSNCHESNKVHMFDYATVDSLKSLTEMRFSRNPTVGAITIGISILAGITPTLVGFDIEPGPRTHYWEERPPQGDYHDPTSEQEWVRFLVEENKVIML